MFHNTDPLLRKVTYPKSPICVYFFIKKVYIHKSFSSDIFFASIFYSSSIITSGVQIPKCFTADPVLRASIRMIGEALAGVFIWSLAAPFSRSYFIVAFDTPLINKDKSDSFCRNKLLDIVLYINSGASAFVYLYEII